jgi:hypothetical protein
MCHPNFFIKINPKKSTDKKQCKNMPIAYQKVKKQSAFITLILQSIQRCSCTSIKGILVINKVNKISRVGQ